MKTARKMPRLKHHPISEIFPMMDKPDREKLREMMNEDGWKGDPAVLLDGKILDGRNREDVASELGLITPTRDYNYVTDGQSPTAFVMRQNLGRRHLTPSQKAAVATEALPFFEEEAKARMKTTQFASRGSIRTQMAHAAAKVVPGSAVAENKAARSAHVHKAAEQAAKAVGASTRSVERAKTVASKSPALIKQVKAGKVTLGAAEKKVQKALGKSIKFEPTKEALDRIQKVCGKELAFAVQNGSRLKTASEAAKFLALSDQQMEEVGGLIEVGWKVDAAIKYKAKALGRGHKLGDLLDRAAANGGAFTLALDWATITVTRAKK